MNARSSAIWGVFCLLLGVGCKPASDAVPPQTAPECAPAPKPPAFVPIVAVPPPPISGERLRIARVDRSQADRLRFFVDVTAADGTPVTGLTKEAFSLFADDRPIAPDRIRALQVRTFGQLAEPIGVSFLLANYRGFNPKSAGEPNPFAAGKAGLLTFLRALGGQRVSVEINTYNEENTKLIQPFSQSYVLVGKTAEDRLQEDSFVELESDVGADLRAPDLYRHIGSIVNRQAGNALLPRRRVLVVISDGMGRAANVRQKQAEAERRSMVIEAALDAGIAIHCVATTLMDDEAFPFLAELAEGTGGTFQRFDEIEKLAGGVAGLLPTLLSQYVIDAELVDAPGGSTALRVDAQVAGKKIVSGTHGPSAGPLPHPRLAEFSDDQLAVELQRRRRLARPQAGESASPSPRAEPPPPPIQ